MADKLHSQGGDVTPELSNRVASGKSGTNVVNSSWQTIVTWLNGALAFLKTASNLADLNDVAVSRTNLDVYSKSENDSAISDKANVADVLTKTNTVTYNPASDYNPATKKYVDDFPYMKGKEVVGNIVDDIVITVTLPHTLTSNNYGVSLTVISKATSVSLDDNVICGIRNLQTTSFDIFLNDTTSDTNDIDVVWFLYTL